MFAFSRRTLFRGGYNRFINTMAEQQQQQRRADIVDNLKNVRTAMENAGTPQKVKSKNKFFFFSPDQYFLPLKGKLVYSKLNLFFIIIIFMRLDPISCR